MTPEQHQADVQRELRRLKGRADQAIAQITEVDFFKVLDEESNSIALIIKHMVGNMRSRWRHFMVSDAEKPDRNRDQEFVLALVDTQGSLLEAWEESWDLLFDTLGALEPEDLDTIVLVRGESHRVAQAVGRELVHYAYHVGQIVFLAKHLAGTNWRTLTIPRGKSDEFNANPKPYLEEL
ncbi:MAG: DUF1572 family protein [Acidobacteriota bacterium]